MAGKWSDEEVVFLREAASSVTLREISAQLGRSVSAVRQKCLKLELSMVDGRSTQQARDRMREFRSANPVSNLDVAWSEDEDIVLRMCAPTATLRELEQMLPGRTVRALRHHCKLLGITFLDGRTTENAKVRISALNSKTQIDDAGRECSKCGTYKPWAEYDTQANGARGRSSRCKACTSQYHSALWRSDLEANRAKGREAERRHRDKVNPDRKRFVPCRQDEGGRECPKCRAYKPWAEFHHFISGHGRGDTWVCKPCWRESVRRSRYIRTYDITVEQFEELEKRQHGLCALHGGPEDRRHQDSGELFYLSIDHDHGCGRHAPEKACKYCIRGLLCYSCNRMLGFAEQRPTVAARFEDYLVRRPLLH